MDAAGLYAQLERDFITPSMTDDWAEYMRPVSEFVCHSFKERSMGLVCDNSEHIHKVYTAVDPSDEVMQSVLGRYEADIMLFVHHPMTWDIRKAPEVFQQMDKGLLQQFRERRTSIYNLHVPLDNYGPYSTSVNLALALGLKPTRPFGQYYGALAGVFAKTELSTVQELKSRFEEAVGHIASLYQYGVDEIRGKKVAVVAGGGNVVSMQEEMAAGKVNTLLTGITVRNEISEASHEYAAANGANLLGGTHYSTEKFACQAMCQYFAKLGLPAEFVEGKPVLEDL